MARAPPGGGTYFSTSLPARSGSKANCYSTVSCQKHTEPFHTGMDFLSFRLKSTPFLTQSITLSFCLVLVYIVVSKCLPV